MQSSKLLEMLNQGKIEEAKAALRDEIYSDVLKNKPGAKKRYSAMKKYFGYVDATREFCKKPCMVEFEGQNYISFCNAHSLALTTEPCGEIELFKEVDRYPDVHRLVNFDGDYNEIDLNEVIAEAKSKGYKLKKNEVGVRPGYLMEYDGTYYKMGLVDATYSIIADEGECTIYHKPGKKLSITIKNNIGYCVIMPINIEDASDYTVIHARK